MDDKWRAFIFGFCVCAVFVSIGIVILAINWLPKLVEQGVVNAMAMYDFSGIQIIHD